VLAPVPPGGILSTDDEVKTLSVCDAVTGREVCRLKGHTQRIACAAFSPDGRCVVTGSDDRTARLWDAESGALFAVFGRHEEEVSAVAFSPDGRRAVTVCELSVRLWDTAGFPDPAIGRSPRPIAVLVGESKKRSFRTAYFSPDGRSLLTIAYGPAGATAQLWPMDPLPVAVARKPRDLTPAERELYEVHDPGVHLEAP
jgi:WD40 repeat protein